MATTDVLLSDPFILNNCISALSNMNNNHDKPKDSHLYTYANKHTRRCVDLLSGLSLLLVRGDKGECCAVTVVRKSTNEAVIRWLKNDSSVITEEDKRYVKLLMKMFKGQDDQQRILGVCVIYCRQKIVKRLRKLWGTVEKNWDTIREITPEHPGYDIVQTRLRQRKVTWSRDTLTDGLASFLKCVEKADIHSSSSMLRCLVNFAEAVTSMSNNHPPLFNPKLRYRLQKVGEYRAIIRYIWGVCKDQKITKLRDEQIPNPPQKPTEVYGLTEDALNTLQPHIPGRLEKLTWAQINRFFPKASRGSGNQGETHSITGTQHCEVTLAHYMIKELAKKGTTGNIEIGCSKPCCHWCQKYLKSLTNHHHLTPMVYRAISDKRPKGWLIPAEDSAVKKEVVEHIGHEAEDVFGDCWGLPRSLTGDFRGRFRDRERESFEGRVTPF